MTAASGNDYQKRSRLTLLLATDQLLQEVYCQAVVAAEVGADLHAEEVEELLLRTHLGGDAGSRDLLPASLHVDVAVHLNLNLLLSIKQINNIL